MCARVQCVAKMEDFGVHDGDRKHLKKKQKSRKRKNVFIALAVVFLVVGLGGLAIILGLKFATYISSNEYGIVFDAGSSHTSMYLYKWNSTKTNNTGEVKEVISCEVKAGPLADFDSNPSAAGPALEDCLNKAADELPLFIKGHTPLYLGATAGMRVLKESNPSASSKILQSVREEFRSSGYKIIDLDQQAKILSGAEEGIGLWITANYVVGLLGISLLPKWSPVLPEGNASTLGTLDLGGASTQIVFAVPHPSAPSIETSKVTLFNKELALFADSFLCYGVGEMRKQLLAILAKKNNYEGELHHPCFAVGYTVNKTYSNMFKSSCTEKFASSTPQNSSMTIVGTGNAGQCENLISDLFNQTFPNITIPPLPDRFVARGSFAYTMNDLNVLNSASQTTYSNFLQGMQNYCSQNHSVVSQLKLYDPNTVCVNARYIHHLLSKTYGMSDDNWDSVVFTNSFNDMSLGWTLGYMTNITSHLAEVPSLDLYNISNFSFYFCLILTIVLILLGVVSIVFACKYQRQKYDSLNVPT